MNKCEGSCEEHGYEHKGDVVLVRVTGLVDFGNFWYCETAIERDEINGFTITPVEAS